MSSRTSLSLFFGAEEIDAARSCRPRDPGAVAAGSGKASRLVLLEIDRVLLQQLPQVTARDAK